MRASHLQFIRRWWLTLLLAAIVAGLSGFLIADRLPATYQAETKVLVGPVTATRDILSASSSLVRTFAELASSDPVRQAAIDGLDLPVTADEIENNVQVRADGETRILSIQVRGDSPAEAAALANEIANQLRAVDTTIPRLPEGQLSIVEPATPPTERFGPQPAQVAVLAGIAGLIAAMLLVLGVDYLSDSIATRDDLPRAVRLLGVVSNRRRTLRKSPTPVDSAPESNAAVLYHVLANRLARDANDEPLAVVVVGVGRADGAGEVGVNLALALRRHGLKVRLVDADVDTHAADVVLGGTGAQPGDLVQYDLNRRSSRRRIVRRGGLQLTSASPVGEESQQLYARMRNLVDVLIIVPPAIASSAIAWMWTQLADGAMIVVQAEQTSRRALDRALASAGQAGANVMGIVLREPVSEGRYARDERQRVEPITTDLSQGGEPQPDA